MLEELSKRDSEWRKIALKICGNKSLSDDIVNDMYLKMYKLQPKEIKTSYIAYAMYHIWINMIKVKEKTLFLDDINYIETNDNDYTTQLRLRVNNALEELGLLDKEMLLHTHEKSLRKTAKMLDMSYGKVFYQKNLALEKLLKTNGIKEWENER